MCKSISRYCLLALLSATSAVALSQTSISPGAVYERSSQAAISANPYLSYAPFTVIVRFKSGVSTSARESAFALSGGTHVRPLMKSLNIELVGTSNPGQTIAALRARPDVQYAEFDFVRRSEVIPNDPSFTSLWGMHNTGQTGGVVDADIDAPEAWDIFTGDANLVIADIDTGVNYTHPDLAGNAWLNPGEVVNGIDDDGNGFIDDIRGWDFVNNDNDPMDDNGHGTHTSGTFGAVGNNGIGVTGVNWNCKIMALKFLSASGSGSTSAAVSCVNYAVNKGVKISNNSWGGGGFSQALYDAINAGKAVGHVFVASAGNSNLNTDVSPSYPASYDLDNIISVASITASDLRSSFSNYGATTVDLGAPGSSVNSTYGSGYASLSGTSMAGPHVTGVVGLVYGQNPSWTYSQVRSRVMSTVRPTAAMAGITVTGGVVNAAAAVAGGSSNTPPTVTISSPGAGSSFAQGATVTFTGTATDVEDGNLTANLVWTSNVSGQIGTGGTFTRNDLAAGTHVVTASATDSASATGNGSVSFTITVGLPAAPSGLTVVKQSNNVARCNWTDNSTNETDFDVERQFRSGGIWVNTTTISVGANVTSLVDAAGNGRFRYRVKARNAAGSSAFTGWVQVNL